MTFGDYHKKLGWTLVTLKPKRALEFTFDLQPTPMHIWLDQTVVKENWTKISFRLIGFKNRSDALLFHLTFG